MKIEFVNHASYIMDFGDIKLISDPWIEGAVFNNGWDLISKTVFDYENFSTITHIWFSHEHPDHFYPPNIKKIPEKYRQNITVLYQKTIDKKVVNYCGRLGFKEVIELSPDVPLKLSSDVSVTCNPWSEGDTYLYVKWPNASCLNINDCGVLTEKEAKSIGDKFGDIDLLLTQFSLSAWEGNPEEVERRMGGAKAMLDRILLQTNVLKPKFVIPLASYIWFCNVENFYINAQSNRIDMVEDEIQKNTAAKPIVMYPGFSWEYGAFYSNDLAVSMHVKDFERLSLSLAYTNPVIPEDKLVKDAEKFIKTLLASSSYFRLLISFARSSYARRELNASGSSIAKIKNVFQLCFLRLEPAKIYIVDLGKAFTFDLKRGLNPIDVSQAACDISLGSDSLSYGFLNLFGGETLQVNGRFSEGYDGGRMALFNYFHIAVALNRGVKVTWSRSIAQRISKALPFLFPAVGNK
jgi:hypothetical protein